MNKFLRLITTIAVALGVALLFAYLALTAGTDNAQLLNQPSYYIRQNFHYLILAGTGSIVFSIVSSFLAWNRKLDPQKEEALPNAVGANKDVLMSWLSGSSLDTTKNGGGKKAKKATAASAPLTEDTATDTPNDTTLTETQTEIQDEPTLYDTGETVLDEDARTVAEGGCR